MSIVAAVPFSGRLVSVPLSESVNVVGHPSLIDSLYDSGAPATPKVELPGVTKSTWVSARPKTLLLDLAPATAEELMARKIFRCAGGWHVARAKCSWFKAVSIAERLPVQY